MSANGRAELPVQRCARLAGVLYLAIIGIGLACEILVRQALIVTGDPAATAANILASAGLWRLGIAGQLVLLLCALSLGWCWYLLLRPAGRKLIWLAMFFGLVSLAVESVSVLQLQAALSALDMAGAAGGDPQPYYRLAYLALAGHLHAFGAALVFFGAECLVIGHLVRKSGYFPPAIGVLMQVAGLCYLVNSFTLVLSPPLHNALVPGILLPVLIGESAFCLWLLFKGVNLPAWEARRLTLS